MSRRVFRDLFSKSVNFETKLCVILRGPLARVPVAIKLAHAIQTGFENL